MSSVRGREILADVLAAQGGGSTLPQLLCTACAAGLPVSGAGLSLMSDEGLSDSVAATDGVAEAMEALQFTCGEGPCVDASRSGRPVLMNLFVAESGPLTDETIALGQGLADMATIGLIQERSIREKDSLAEQLQGALNSRVMIEQAKGILSERRDMSMGEAFAAMRDYARRTRQPLSEVAAAVTQGSLDDAVLRQR